MSLTLLCLKLALQADKKKKAFTMETVVRAACDLVALQVLAQKEICEDLFPLLLPPNPCYIDFCF